MQAQTPLPSNAPADRALGAPLPADPPPDPELGVPLPPLETFDVAPQPDAAAPAPPDNERPTLLRYSLAVEGLDLHGLDDRFRELSLLAEGTEERVSAAQIDARIEEDVALAQRLLQSEGYYGAAVDWQVEALEAPNRVRVTLTATPGRRYRFDRIAVAPPDPRAAAIVRQVFPLKRGDAIVASDVEAAETTITLKLPEAGYPFVAVGPRDIVLEDRTATGDYTLPLTSGPLASFGRVRLAGKNLPFGERHANVLARFDRGDIYDSRLVEDLRRATVATALFSAVAVRTLDTGQTAADGTRVVDVQLEATGGPERQLAAAAGYSTGEGFRVEGLWRHRNLFPPEGALTLRAVAGTREQRLAGEFRRSNAGLRDRSLLLLAEAANENREAFNARTLTLSGRLARESTPIWQKRWTYAVGIDLIASDERDESRTPRGDGSRPPRRTFFTAALPLLGGYDRSDSLLDPTRGFRVVARVSPEASLQSGGFTYVRSQLDGSAYLGIGDAVVLAARTRAGAIFGAARGRIAPSRRFYAGGGGSVRGFGYQELGPRDEDGDPLGGRSLIEASLEARYRFGYWGAAAFIDAGQLYTTNLPRLRNLRYAIGVGARYYTNFGPIRVDVARALARRRGDPPVAVYVSIGQAF